MKKQPHRLSVTLNHLTNLTTSVIFIADRGEVSRDWRGRRSYTSWLHGPNCCNIQIPALYTTRELRCFAQGFMTGIDQGARQARNNIRDQVECLFRGIHLNFR